MKHLSTSILGLFTDHHLKLNIILHTYTHISDHKENKSSSETFDPPRTPCQPSQIFEALRISIRSVLGSGHLIHCQLNQFIYIQIMRWQCYLDLGKFCFQLKVKIVTKALITWEEETLNHQIIFVQTKIKCFSVAAAVRAEQ